jgi:hypothetical protein
MKFLRSVLIQDEAQAVSVLRTDDLPVNPLSMILLTVKGLNDTGTLTDFTLVSALLGMITKVEILYKGSAIISGSLNDLARMNAILIGRGPMQVRATEVNNATRAITIPIMLGRSAYDMLECFPAVRRGELQLQITTGAAITGIDTIVLQVETVELLDAKPTRFLKYTTITKTPTATGDHDVDLPIGNKIAGALLFGTTVPVTASYDASFGQVRLLVDNVESYYARTNWETLHNGLSLRVAESPQTFVHKHISDLGAAYAQFQITAGPDSLTPWFNNYAFLDFDPRGDDQFLLETAGRARIHLRINAEAADAIRILPAELIDVATANISL